MLHSFRHTFRICQLLLWVLAFAACSGGGASDDDDPTVDPTQQRGTYLTLTIAPQGAARTSRGPSGGEGPYNEAALSNETTVTNATIFLYQAASGINAAADTPILFALYAPQFSKTETSTVAYTSGLLRSEKDIPAGTYHILVVTNMGDLSSLTTLGTLRDALCTQPYKQTSATDPSAATDFVMTSYDDQTVTLAGEGGADHPHNVSATVQRLAARLDFGPGTSTEVATATTIETSDGTTHTIPRHYRYEVQNQDGTKNGDIFLLTDVTPFNLLSSGTSLIKRTTRSTSDLQTFTYAGRETADANGLATNFVLDPWTLLKTSQTLPEGLTYATPYASVASLQADQLLPLRETTVSTTDGLRYYILSYTQENTLTTTSPTQTYATGIRVDGYYGKHKSDGTYSYSAKTYTHFIRHADPHNSSAALPMKYGIVRNNIYRLYVNRVTSLGVVLIQVRDWGTRQVEEIEI